MENDITGLQTPCYIIDKDKFIDNSAIMKSRFADEWGQNLTLGYSVKTNHTPAFLNYAHNEGMLAEVVSDDEFMHAESCGFTPDRIIFNGPRKSEDTLIRSLQSGAFVNLDNFSEIGMIKRNASKLNAKKITVGLRVNFDLEKVCPGETSAGNEMSRFGFCAENGDLERAIGELSDIGIPISGLHMHTSSSTRSLAIFRALSEAAVGISRKYGLIDQIRFIDTGGGFFMGECEHTPGKPDMKDYAGVICKTLREAFDPQRVQLILEPGAAILASSVKYVCKAVNVRDIRGVRFITSDGSLIHINPFLAKRVQPAEVIYAENKRRGIPQSQIVCGSTCIEMDRLLYLDRCDGLEPDDMIVFKCTGAYTMSLNSCFIDTPPYIYEKTRDGYNLLRNKNSGMMAQI